MTPSLPIYIRVDAGGGHGLGHVRRMAALAQALRHQGACAVTFVTQTPDAVRPSVAPLLGPGCALVTDPPLETLLPPVAPGIWVLDRKPAYDQTAVKGLHTRGHQVVGIDDPAAAPGTYDLLVGPGCHWAPDTVQRLRTDFGACFLYGWDYVILPAEVTSQAPLPYAERQDGPIVFCTGGSDPEMALPQMWTWMCDSTLDAEQLFCVGELAQTDTMIRAWEAARRRAPRRVRVVPFSRQSLRHAALVVAMFGVTPYECLWYRTPTLMLAHTRENEEGANHLTIASYWANRSLGAIENMDEKSFTTILRAYWQDTDTRQRMHSASAALLDDQGAARIATRILALAA